MDNKKISLAVIKRLPRYYRYLGDLLDNDIQRISSVELSKRMNITASQIRQDFNNFGCFGIQGYGYNVESLYKEIQTILGLDVNHKLIVIGVGNLGSAILNYKSFKNRGFEIIGAFDNSEEIIGKTIADKEVQDIKNLSQFLDKNKVDIAVLTIPSDACDKIIDILSVNGVRGVWNFSNSEIEVPSYMMQESVRLSDSLMTLSYRINEEEILKKYPRG